MRKLRLGWTKLPSVNQVSKWWSRDSNSGLGPWSLHFSLWVVEMYLMYVLESEIPWVWFSYPLAASCALEQITILLCFTEKANDRTCLIGLLWDWNSLMQAKCLTHPSTGSGQWGYISFCCYMLMGVESPLGWKEIKPVNPRGNQSWIFTGRTDAEAEPPIFCPPDAKNWLIWKDPDAGNDWRWEEKGTAEDG